MSIKVFIISAYFLSIPFYVVAQNAGRDVLWDQIAYLRDSSKSVSLQLKKLLELEAKIDDYPSPTDSAYAYLFQRIGYTWYAQMDYFKAIDYTKRAIEIISLSKGKKDNNTQRLVDCYYNLAIYHGCLKQQYEKNAAIDSCFAVSTRTNYGYLYSLYLLKGKADEIINEGDYQRSLNYAILGESLSRRSSLIDYVLGFRMISVNALVLMNEFDRAKEVLLKTIDEITNTPYKTYMGAVYDKLAELELSQGDVNRSLANFKKSLALNSQIGYDFGCHQTLTNMGYLLYFKHNRDGRKALDCYRRAINYLSKSKSPTPGEAFELLNLYANIANVYVMQANYDSAFNYFQRSFDIIQPGINEEGVISFYQSNPQLYKKPDFIISLILDKADAFLAKYKNSHRVDFLWKAITIYKNADRFFDRAREDQSETLSKLNWRMQHRRLYEHAIEACLLSANNADAFYFFERSKAAVLSDQLNEQRRLGENDISKLAQLRKKILEEEKADVNNDTSQSAMIQKELFNSKQDLAILTRQIKEKNPLYYQSFLDSDFVKLSQMETWLVKNSKTILELFNGDSAVYTMLISPDRTAIYRIPKPEFDSTVTRFIFFLANPAQMNSHFADYRETAFHLYQLIFQHNHVTTASIIISPDGQYFPFEALLTNNADEQVPYFLNEHAVSYTYSARFLLTDFDGMPSGGKSFMGMAPVKYPGPFSLASLSGSDHSLKTISDHFDDPTNFTAGLATRHHFLEQFYKHSIIQLYTHGSASDNNISDPVIYFADSALFLSELIGENKPLTRLIVLSACETGAGKEYQGEGVFSFNRGFAALGIPSSVTNLWTIDNESTYQLTELFYKNIAKGFALDKALQKAKLELIKNSSREKQLPCYWAATIIVGNTDSIQLSRNNNWRYYTAAIVIPVLLAGIFIVVRNRRRIIPIRGRVEIAS